MAILIFSAQGCIEKDIPIEEKPLPEIKIEKITSNSYNPFSKEPVYFLLLGSDSRSEDFKGLSDSIMLIKVDPQQKKISQVSFPRDSRVYIEGVGNQKINTAMYYGGPELAVKTVERLSGVEIDYFMVSTFASFKRAINEIGGVRIVLDEPLYDRWAGAKFDAGELIMNGEKALAYSRARHIKDGDFRRAAHQQELVEAVYNQEKEKKSLVDIVNRVRIINDQLSTNLNPVESFKLGWLLLSLDNVTFEQVVLPGYTRTIGGVSYVILNQGRVDLIFQNLKDGKPLN